MVRETGTIFLVLFAATVWPQVAAVRDDSARRDQQPITTLSVTTRVVAISAVVKTKSGETRGGLTKDDFVLRQDGKEEPIRYFSQGSDLPLTLALMVDTSGSQRTFIDDEVEASDVFLETMLGSRGEDRAMLVQFDDRVRELKGMTSSVQGLHLALVNLSQHGSRVSGTLLDDAVYAVAKEVLLKERGRKAIIILSDGGENGSRRSLAEATEQAQRADAQIYSILYSEWGSQETGGAGQNMSSLGPSGVYAQNSGREILQKLSESTGGRVFTVSAGMGLREIFAQIAEELRLQYELGYTPPPDLQPNSYHRLELRARDKKLMVQARRGFFAQP